METTFIVSDDETVQEGLNRTMQYGNEEEKDEYKEQTIRLNRTMQYGNSCRPLFS